MKDSRDAFGVVRDKVRRGPRHCLRDGESCPAAPAKGARGCGPLESGRYLGVMESMMEADATWARVHKEAGIFASIYDPEVFVRHPDGIFA